MKQFSKRCLLLALVATTCLHTTLGFLGKSSFKNEHAILIRVNTRASVDWTRAITVCPRVCVQGRIHWQSL